MGLTVGLTVDEIFQGENENIIPIEKISEDISGKAKRLEKLMCLQKQIYSEVKQRKGEK